MTEHRERTTLALGMAAAAVLGAATVMWSGFGYDRGYALRR